MTAPLIESYCWEHPYGCGGQSHRRDRFDAIRMLISNRLGDVTIDDLCLAIALLADEVEAAP